MRAVVYHAFGAMPAVETVPDPAPGPGEAIIAVRATGLCRSDWHGWQGHDPDIRLPHVPGHELAGEVVALGAGVQRWTGGERVTVPFVCACGVCVRCAAGDQQVCDDQRQPGFTHWGAFAEYVVIPRADLNLVPLADAVSFAAAASLGCRFTTSFRAIVDQGRARPGDWVAVHGCGGVGLSAVMIAAALGARVVAVDVAPEALELARACGAEVLLDATQSSDVAEAVRAATQGGAHVSLDALGSPETCFNSVASLRKRGRHVQVGLMAGGARTAAVPMARVLADELEIVGSHGMPAHRFPAVLALVESGRLHPEALVQRTIGLEEAPAALAAMGTAPTPGVTLITRF